MKELLKTENEAVFNTSILDVLLNVESFGSARVNRNSVLILASGLSEFIKNYAGYNSPTDLSADYYIVTEFDDGTKSIIALNEDMDNVEVDDYSIVMFSIFESKPSDMEVEPIKVDVALPVLIKELKFKFRGRGLRSDLDYLDQIDMKIMH